MKIRTIVLENEIQAKCPVCGNYVNVVDLVADEDNQNFVDDQKLINKCRSPKCYESKLLNRLHGVMDGFRVNDPECAIKTNDKVYNPPLGENEFVG